MRSVETISGMGAEIKAKGGVWYIWYIVRTYVNATMSPHPVQQ
jgi:hypothetical protein